MNFQQITMTILIAGVVGVIIAMFVCLIMEFFRRKHEDSNILQS
jgi:hypothetical protein